MNSCVRAYLRAFLLGPKEPAGPETRISSDLTHRRTIHDFGREVVPERHAQTALPPHPTQAQHKRTAAYLPPLAGREVGGGGEERRKRRMGMEFSIINHRPVTDISSVTRRPHTT